jgi:hypothetical protein
VQRVEAGRELGLQGLVDRPVLRQPGEPGQKAADRIFTA